MGPNTYIAKAFQLCFSLPNSVNRLSSCLAHYNSNNERYECGGTLTKNKQFVCGQVTKENIYAILTKSKLLL